MCGIVGYVGTDSACAILIDGLKKLEYRGYDSAGVAVMHEGRVNLCRVKGKISCLQSVLDADGVPPGRIGVGHTRWATHGKPSVANAHPHKAGRAVVVHNGIIENYTEIKKNLIALGHTFTSETDTETIAQLIDHHLRSGLEPLRAIQATCRELRGSFAVGILFEDEQETLYAVRQDSPLIIGLGEKQTYIASDIPALLSYTRRMVFMDDGEIAVLKPGSAQFMDFDCREVRKTTHEIALDPVTAGKGGYKHFMLKEIFEQPQAIANTLRGRMSYGSAEVALDGIKLSEKEIKDLQRIMIVACGTSYHAGLVAKRMIEELARIPVDVDIGSEFRYRDPIVGPNTLLISISQSGETADTRAATYEGARKGAKTLAICNVIESSLARMAQHGVIYTQAGPEIGVASTKAFTTQITTLYLLAIYLGGRRGRLSREWRQELLDDLVRLPELTEKALLTSDQLRTLAARFQRYSSFLFLGRGINTPLAYEGALKLKEISYIHAEAYPGGEMKHGPIALISPEMPVVVVISRDRSYEKMLSNMEEVHSRGGLLIAFTNGDGDPRLHELAQEVIQVPVVNEYLTTILLTIPLQLFAYHVADLKGNDVDQPRNLAKSVTVE